MSDLSKLKDFVEILQAVISSTAIVVAGWWAYRRYYVQAESHPHIATSCQIKFIGLQRGQWMIELIATLENKGKVEHRFKDFTFDLNGIRKCDSLVQSIQWGGQINFPIALAEGSLLPSDFQFFSLGPGVTGNYSFVTSVPDDIKFLILHCRFRYMDRLSYSHSMECTQIVPQPPVATPP